MSAAPPWYRPKIGPHLRQPTRSLFNSYCNLSGLALDYHLYEIVSAHRTAFSHYSDCTENLPKRERAWKIRPFPCIGQWGFLEPGIFHSDAYDTVLERLKKGQTFLDIGCCMGQDIRRLAVDGAPTENMYAADIIQDFWDIGYDLFQDRDVMNAHFVKADLLDSNSELRALHSKVDVIYVASVLHLFGWDKQLEATRELVRLSKVNTTVLGCQLGRDEPGERASKWNGNTMFYHNVESFEEMWRIIGKDTGTQWKVAASLGNLDIVGLEKEDLTWMRPDMRLLQFLVIRMES